MKKLLSVALIATMLISCFAFTTFAETTYDSTWTITTDKDSYNAGDYMAVTINNSNRLVNKFNKGSIHITFDEALLEYASEDDDNFWNAFPTAKGAPSQVEISGAADGYNTEKPGEYISVLASAGSQLTAIDFYTIYFKVKSDVKGTHALTFRWIEKESDYGSYAAYWDANNESVYYNMKYVSKTVTVKGADLAADNTVLPAAKAFASANDFTDGKVDINGTEKTISTAYAAAFGTVVPRNNASRVKAGFLLSASNTGLTVDNKDIKNFEAANFASDNIFGGLFYGPGLEAGKTYYVMPYVTYSDNVTLYAPSAVSFTMPN